jgi:hypothetical protein
VGRVVEATFFDFSLDHPALVLSIGDRRFRYLTDPFQWFTAALPSIHEGDPDLVAVDFNATGKFFYAFR